jgi:hypothetical protein
MLTMRKRGKNWHLRGSIRVGRETRVVKEHSCGTDRRDIADAYRSKLETDIRYEILHGSRGRTQTLTIADAGLRYTARPGGIRSYDLWRIGEINKAVGERPIAQTADAWSEFKRIRCGGILPATVQRFRATFLAAVNYLARDEGFDPPKLPRGDRLNNKRIRFLSSDQADRLVSVYADHVRPIATTLRWQGMRIGEALRIDWVHVNWSWKFDLHCREQVRRSAHRDYAQAHAGRIASPLGFVRITERRPCVSYPAWRSLCRSAPIQDSERKSDQEGARHGVPPCWDR